MSRSRPLPRLQSPYALLAIVLALGLGLRLLLAYVFFPESGYWLDLALFASWALSLAYHGPGDFYRIAGFADYPAGYLVVLWLIGWLSAHISPDDVFLTRLLIKIPPILADVGVALVLYWATRRLADEKAALLATAIYLFNPVTWLDSALWGQVDSVGTLVLLLAVLALLARQPELAALSGVAAILVKPQFAILAPVIALVLLRRHLFGWRRDESEPSNAGRYPLRTFARSGGGRLITSTLLASLPVFLVPRLFDQSPLDLIGHMRNQTDQYAYASMSAFNPWALLGVLQTAQPLEPGEIFARLDDRVPLFLSVSPYVVGLALFIGVGTYALWWLWRRLDTGREETALWVCSSTLVLAFFVLATRMHERYAFPFFALALPLAVRSRSWFLAYLAATIGCFANMYVIYARSDLGLLADYRPDPLTGALSSPIAIAGLSILVAATLLWILFIQSATREAREAGFADDATASTLPLRPLGQAGDGHTQQAVEVGGEVGSAG